MKYSTSFRTGIIIVILALLIVPVDGAVNIIPKPRSMTIGAGTFTVPATVIIAFDSKSDSIVPWVQKLFLEAGVPTQLGSSSSAQVILTRTNTLDSLAPEGYQLKITASAITIASSTYKGQFYGVQTLRQLFPPEIERGNQIVTIPKPILLQQVDISDKPRYAFRGSMLDPARTFLEIPVIKAHIDRMSLLKMNRLHLHLTDDQGWRLEIKAYPKLTTVGSMSQVGSLAPTGAHWFYSQDEMKALIQYGELRNVTIVPEFDMPGHTQAALASYPEFAIAGANTDLYIGINTGFSTLNCKSSVVTKFVEDLFAEVSALFPSDIIHVGGDECQSTTPADYITFIAMAEQVLKNKGKKMMGWEEIAKAIKETTSLPQAWNKNAAGKILSWCDKFFVDHANDANDKNAMGWCASVVPIQSTYTVSTAANWTGVECCLWGEYIKSMDILDKRNFPRIAAAGEVGWASSNNDWNEFKARVAPFGKRFDAMGIKWYTGDNTVAWEHGTTYTTTASVFQDFIPVLPTAITVPDFQKMAQRIVSCDGKVFDVRGRVVGVVHNQVFTGTSALSKPGQGIYFFVDEKFNKTKTAKVTIFLNK